MQVQCEKKPEVAWKLNFGC